MTQATIRILLVAFLVAFVYGGVFTIQQGMKPTSIELPAWNVDDLPMQIDGWKGEEEKLPLETINAVGAQSTMNRSYGQTDREPISFHMSVYDDYDVALSHRPIVCYQANGWHIGDVSSLEIETSDGGSVSIALTEWERDGNRATVVHWYQLGDHVITDRFQLGKVRARFLGKEKWPAMVKVLMHTSTDKVEHSEEGMQELAGFVYRWMKDPDFRKSCTTVTAKSGNGEGIPQTAS